MFTGFELLRFWKAGKLNGLSQRKLANLLGIGFNSLHGKLFREQQKQRIEVSTLKTQTYTPVTFDAAVFDIETMSFFTGGVRNHIICTSVLPLKADKPTTFTLKFSDAGNDKKLIDNIVSELEKYDILIGHNIIAFDFNWLNSRIIYHGMPPMGKRWLYYDTYFAAKRIAIKTDRKSLGFLADFFRIPGEKTSVLPVSWGMIDSRNEDEFDEAMEDIVYHCEQDVLLNRQLFYALWPRDHSLGNLPITKKW